jgi:hypothetical protein
MIISDIDLPDRSGLELLGELGRRGLSTPILFVSAYLKAYGPQIPPHANVDIREKPVQLEDLRSIVQSRLGKAPEEEAPFAVTDYIQLACLGHRSVVVDVESRDERGTIVIWDGAVWDAKDARGSGKAAFQRLAFLPDAVARVRAIREAPGEQRIRDSWEGLLLDAAREIDESKRGSQLARSMSFEQGEHEGIDDLGDFEDVESRQAEPPPAPEPEPEPEPDAFEIAWDEGVTALLKDYRSAYEAFLRASEIRPEDPKVQANLERLRELGHGG